MTDDIRLIGDGEIRFVDIEASAAAPHSGSATLRLFVQTSLL